ncbi:hypothetical protein LZ023_40110 (plasmid) [Pseudomonas silvicola]|nr:hypothetical protein LZ023_40110 [Pseudomonas silvicola]
MLVHDARNGLFFTFCFAHKRQARTQTVVEATGGGMFIYAKGNHGSPVGIALFCISFQPRNHHFCFLLIFNPLTGKALMILGECQKGDFFVF